MGKTIMWSVIVLASIFADVMFIALIRDALPGGIMGAGAIAGAFVTSLSIIGLVMGKTHWFRPGEQIWVAWIFTGVEILVAVLNVITAIQFARHQNLGFLSYWLAYGAPCTPFIPMIGWIVIAFVNPERAQHHAEMEMEDEMHKAELEYQKAAHAAHMEVMHDQLEQFTGFLQEFTHSPENLDASRQAAHKLGRQVLGNITGMAVGAPGSSFIFQQPTQQQLPAPEVTGELVAMPKTASTPVPQTQMSELQALSELGTNVPMCAVHPSVKATGLVGGQWHCTQCLVRFANGQSRPLAQAPSNQQNGNGANSNHQ